MSNRLSFILTRVVGLMRRNEPQAGYYHDLSVPSRYHFALRLRRRHRFQSVSADVPEPFIADKIDPPSFGLNSLVVDGSLDGIQTFETCDRSHKQTVVH